MVARRGQVDRGVAVVGPARQPVARVARRHADLGRPVVAARIAPQARIVVVVARVAGGGHEQDAAGPEAVDLVGERLGERRADEGGRVVDDPDVDARLLGLKDPLQRRDEAGGRAGARRVQPLDGQDRRRPVHPGYADRVAARRAEDARHVRAVPGERRVVVHRVAAGGQHVVAVRPGGTAAHAARVRPDVAHQVGMGVVDAGVGLGDDDRRAARGDVPGRGRAVVDRSPLQREVGVVERRGRAHEVVRLGVADLRPAAQRADGGELAPAAHAQADGGAGAADPHGAGSRRDRPPARGRDTGPEADQHEAGAQRRPLRRGGRGGAAPAERDRRDGEHERTPRPARARSLAPWPVPVVHPCLPRAPAGARM